MTESPRKLRPRLAIAGVTGVTTAEAILPIAAEFAVTRREKLLIKCQAALITC